MNLNESGQASHVFQKEVRIYFILLSISVLLFYEYLPALFCIYLMSWEMKPALANKYLYCCAITEDRYKKFYVLVFKTSHSSDIRIWSYYFSPLHSSYYYKKSVNMKRIKIMKLSLKIIMVIYTYICTHI